MKRKPLFLQHDFCTEGFTLVETLIAIAVLMIAIVGPFTAISNALNASYAARNQLIASNLAQEGIEYVHHIRDNNFLANHEWLWGFDGNPSGADCTTPIGTTPAVTCTVDPKLNTASLCDTSATCPLNIDTTTNLYTQGSGTPSLFTRRISIEHVDDGSGDVNREVLVTVTVTWNFHGAQSITLTDYLQNWL